MPKSTEIKVLIAHSNPLVSAGLVATLGKEGDLRVASYGDKLRASPRKSPPLFSPDVIVADYDSGLHFAASCDRVVILTHTDSEAKICHALERGARGYLLLDCGLQDLLDSLRSVHAGGIALAPLAAARVADRMKHKALTSREGQVLRQLMMGLSNKSIASELALAEGTVKTHVKSILIKLDARSRTGAVAIAQRRGLLGEDCDWLERSVRRVGRRDPGRSRPLNFQRKLRRAKYQDVLAPTATP
jgi:DNA-binding NarL/FixJ family response regulator